MKGKATARSAVHRWLLAIAVALEAAWIAFLTALALR
jgi:hypothetical protein